MRRAFTAASLGRWHTVLAAFLAAAAALAALSRPLGVEWLLTASLVVAAAGAVTSLGIVVWKARKEAAGDRAELRRLLKDEIKPVSAVDPLTIGIDPAVAARTSDSGLPPYVPRRVDQVLSDAIVAALNGSGAWLVVMEGESKIGKSRTLFEALRAYPGANRLHLVAPEDRYAPRSILLPHETVAISGAQVLWLDDLELFLNQGVTLKILREWQGDKRGRIVVATFGGKSIADPKSGTAARELNSVAAEVLNSAYARRIQMEQTCPEEIAHLQQSFTADEFSEMRGYGLAAYLVAGPKLERKLNSGKHGELDAPCWEGRAVVLAAIDWARCGRTDTISEATLRQLWPIYLRDRGWIPRDDATFAAGVDWALRPVAGRIALLQSDDGYQAYDYAVRLAADTPTTESPPDPVWAAAIGTAADAQASVVAYSAGRYGRHEDAATAYAYARQSSNAEIAALAGYNLGVQLHKLGRLGEALDAVQSVIDDHVADPDPVIRLWVAFALYCKGKVLDDASRLDEALNVFKRVIEDYGDITASGLWNEVLAGALHGMGGTLGRLGESEAAVSCYGEVIDRFGTDADAQVQRLAVSAVYRLAVELGNIGDSENAIAILEQVNTDYGTDVDPELRLLAIQALTARGTELRKLGRSEEAIATYTQVIDTCATSSDPVLSREATAARFNMGVALRALNRPEEAIATYQRLIDDHSADPELRETVAMALVDMATALGMAGRADDAITACQQVIDEYGADSTKGLRRQTAKARYNMGVALSSLGRKDDAIAAFSQVRNDYGADDDSILQDVVTKAVHKLGS